MSIKKSSHLFFFFSFLNSQGTFVHDGCGGAGPFPAFRRLDCEDEIPKPSWDFYNEYARACLKNQPTPSSGGDDTPKVSPTKPPTGTKAPTTPQPTRATTPRPTPKPYIPSGGGSSPSGPSSPSEPSGGSSKPYYPPGGADDDDSTSSSSSYSSSGGKKKHHFRNFFLVCLIGGVGFYYYKRRTDAFSFGRHRNTRNYAGGGSEMYSAPYSGLTMDSGSGAFQPPSLPPTPSAIDGSMMG